MSDQAIHGGLEDTVNDTENYLRQKLNEALQLLREHQAAHGPASKWDNINLTESEKKSQEWRHRRDALLEQYPGGDDIIAQILDEQSHRNNVKFRES